MSSMSPWVFHHRSSRPFVGSRGCAWSPRASTDFEHLDVQLGPNAHPALRNKLVRRALAYGIDRTALVRQIWGEVDPSARALDSAVHLAQSRYYEPNWSAYRYRPAEARRLLGQAGCRRGADGIFSCGGQRLSLRFVTSAGVPVRAQVLPLIQAQLRAVGVEVVPVFAAPGGVLRPDPPAGDVRRRTLLVGRLTGCIVGRRLRLRRAAELHRATASGSSPPTSTRPTGSSTTVDAPVSSTEPTGGSRVTSRRSRSSSSSSRPRTTPLSGTSCSSPGTRSGTRRTGGSSASLMRCGRARRTRAPSEGSPPARGSGRAARGARRASRRRSPRTRPRCPRTARACGWT